MVDESVVTAISSICAVLNCAYIAFELYAASGGYIRNATSFNLVTAAVCALSLGSDIMLLKSVSCGSTMPRATTGNQGIPKGTLKRMRLALCAKALVITFEFFAAIFDGYNCAQDCLRYLYGNNLKWQEEALLMLFLIGTTIATAIKGVLLFLIHDYYEGVKQQGTLTSNGLEDTFEKEEPGLPATPQQVPQPIPGVYYPAGGMLLLGAPMPTGGPAAAPAQR
ncbi:uncharacterized protein [Dermacentor albipictus]|uniref:uncharacterized protein isoform X2 n=1 Tax=Dermacentor albipictus TaxID=60249 RepID=UPI0031FDA407